MEYDLFNTLKARHKMYCSDCGKEMFEPFRRQKYCNADCRSHASDKRKMIKRKAKRGDKI